MNQATETKKRPIPLNGVDTPTMFATIDAIAEQPALGKLQFHATNRWRDSCHSVSRIESFRGFGGEQLHADPFDVAADRPPALGGTDRAPAPVEYLLHGLVGCLTSVIVAGAAARGITLTAVDSEVEGDLNLVGLLGLDPEVRNGYQSIRVRYEIRGDAPEDKLKEIVEKARRSSAVYDVLSNGVPIEMTVGAKQEARRADGSR